jgi:hypothetical protein
MIAHRSGLVPRFVGRQLAGAFGIRSASKLAAYDKNLIRIKNSRSIKLSREGIVAQSRCDMRAAVERARFSQQ